MKFKLENIVSEREGETERERERERERKTSQICAVKRQNFKLERAQSTNSPHLCPRVIFTFSFFVDPRTFSSASG